jgi:VanZ family protein
LPPATRYAGVLAVAAGIAYFSLTGDPPAQPSGNDKTLHFVAYATLGLAIAYATLDDQRPLVRAALIIGGAGLYGVGIELVQWSLPERYFGLGDIAANLSGATLALSWLLAERVTRYVPLTPDTD